MTYPEPVPSSAIQIRLSEKLINICPQKRQRGENHVRKIPTFDGTFSQQGLWQTNAAFESLVHRHGEVSDRLHSISRIGAEPGREAEELRRRQAALEEEMLIIMDQSSRV